jgi:hypothetical protein
VMSGLRDGGTTNHQTNRGARGKCRMPHCTRAVRRGPSTMNRVIMPAFMWYIR